MLKLNINGKDHQLDVPKEMPLLWVIRDILKLNGTKFGCGIGQCGACTIHVDGEAVRSCSLAAGDAIGSQINTIESLVDHPVQRAWIEHQVPQCGYCQSGQIMAAAALLRENKKPSDSDINDSMTNICRCGTYQRIREAIHLVAKQS